NAAATSAATADASSITITDTSYTSSLTSIAIGTVATGSGDDTVTYYTADITVTDATAVRSAFANNEYGTNITAKPSRIAAEHDAVLAINGDYYGFRSDGILIRNGVIYRDSGTRDGMAFYSDGRVEVYDETTTKAQTLLDAGVWNTLSFGPALVNNSKVLSGIDQVEVDTNVGNHSIQGKQPRTAVGWVETNHLKLVVVDGRNEGYSRGVTMSELAQIMADLGCTCAYNIDGGGSSAMYFNGSIINQPSNGGERDTSDILYIANGA
ncbi:phosphodiester glycosidase family protein, partial [Propionibacterium acidifaciens]|uniref:phosphodiester glycosidase family protein n=1 Tax=Propionibacterium acidifaciens TaxID=556499 RepID=UPI003609BAA9